MNKSKLPIAASLLLFSGNSFAEFFCISDQGKPKHCDAGDIILVQPKMMPRVCDFEKQILRMPKQENKADYLCVYTGTIRAVKELQRRADLRAQRQLQQQQMQALEEKKTERKSMFGNMPFFK
jgi:hypothetical protein